MTWPRPVPLVGDITSAAHRRESPTQWRLSEAERAAIYGVIGSRRDIRRYRADSVDAEVLERVLAAAHAAPSVGHSQPWRFVVVDDPALRERAALMADRARLAQAEELEPDASRRLLDLQLEGIREAPLGVVVCCDRRTPASGVLGRSTFADADLWSCACAIENLWLAARAEGLGVGWVTLFEPDELATLIGLPDGVVTLGWLCIGWPDERPPEPGLERAGWSRRAPLSSVVAHNRWPDSDAPVPPPSALRAPGPRSVVGSHDDADELLTPPGSLGILDRYLDRTVALAHPHARAGCLVVVAGRHRVVEHGVSAYRGEVTDDLLDATRAGRSVGARAADSAGLALRVVDAGWATGDLADTDPLTVDEAAALLERGRVLGAELGAHYGVIALGEVGVGNTTVASALAASLLSVAASAVVGLGAGADSAMIERKTAVISRALRRFEATATAINVRASDTDPVGRLAALGGPEFAVLTGVVFGAAEAGSAVVLDGLATSVCALLAVEARPAVASYLIAGQRSRERAHAAVLSRLGLEPLLDLRLRAGEGVGACWAAQLLLSGLSVRASAARTVHP